MSLKENMSMVKEELNSEEKFFEKAVITEKFVKKYKNIMIGLVVAVIVVVVANVVLEANKNSEVKEANQLLATLKANSKDENAKTQLSHLSPNLYDVWSFSQAIVHKDIETLKKLQSSKANLIGDLASYEVASQSGNVDKLNDYSMRQGAIYKDLALVQSAIIFLDKNELDKAHQKLKQVSATSPLSKIVLALSHYGVK